MNICNICSALVQLNKLPLQPSPLPVFLKMQILVNGEPLDLESSKTVAELLADLELTERRLAVEINGEILPRSEYAMKQISPDDQLEIVHAIGGG